MNGKAAKLQRKTSKCRWRRLEKWKYIGWLKTSAHILFQNENRESRVLTSLHNFCQAKHIYCRYCPVIFFSFGILWESGWEILTLPTSAQRDRGACGPSGCRNWCPCVCAHVRMVWRCPPVLHLRPSRLIDQFGHVECHHLLPSPAHPFSCVNANHWQEDGYLSHVKSGAGRRAECQPRWDWAQTTASHKIKRTTQTAKTHCLIAHTAEPSLLSSNCNKL